MHKIKPLRIQIVLPFTSLTGGNMVLVELANRLSRRGHQVWMIYEHIDIPWWKPRGFLRTSLRDAGWIPWFRWHKVEVPVVRCHVFEDQYVPDADVIVASYWRHIPRIAGLSDTKGTKIYYVQAYETDFVTAPEVKELVDATYRAAMKYVVVADWISEILKSKFGQFSSKICPPLSDEFLRDIPPRRKFDGRCIMQHHIPVAKGIPDGLAAFAAAKNEVQDLSLSLFGPHSHSQSGPYRKLGQILTRKMPSLYDEHDLFIWPSLREGFGLPPLEAMARGLGVATTDNAGSREFAFHGETALVSPPGNPEALAANIVRLALDEGLRNQLASESMKMAKTRFTWDHVCSEFEKVFSE